MAGHHRSHATRRRARPATGVGPTEREPSGGRHCRAAFVGGRRRPGCPGGWSRFPAHDSHPHRARLGSARNLGRRVGQRDRHGHDVSGAGPHRPPFDRSVAPPAGDHRLPVASAGLRPVRPRPGEPQGRRTAPMWAEMGWPGRFTTRHGTPRFGGPGPPFALQGCLASVVGRVAQTHPRSSPLSVVRGRRSNAWYRVRFGGLTLCADEHQSLPAGNHRRQRGLDGRFQYRSDEFAHPHDCSLGAHGFLVGSGRG